MELLLPAAPPLEPPVPLAALFREPPLPPPVEVIVLKTESLPLVPALGLAEVPLVPPAPTVTV